MADKQAIGKGQLAISFSLPATAPALAGLVAAAALAGCALLPRPPDGERGKGQDDDEDGDGGEVHYATSFGAGRKIAQSAARSTRIVTAVQNPKPPPQTSMPTW